MCCCGRGTYGKRTKTFGSRPIARRVDVLQTDMASDQWLSISRPTWSPSMWRSIDGSLDQWLSRPTWSRPNEFQTLLVLTNIARCGAQEKSGQAAHIAHHYHKHGTSYFHLKLWAWHVRVRQANQDRIVSHRSDATSMFFSPTWSKNDIYLNESCERSCTARYKPRWKRPVSTYGTTLCSP